MEQPAYPGVSEELLDEALEESFPASDPLSFWSGPDNRHARPVGDPEPGRTAQDARASENSAVGKRGGSRG